MGHRDGGAAGVNPLTTVGLHARYTVIFYRPAAETKTGSNRASTPVGIRQLARIDLV
jgi:hypothetical protein